MFRSIINRSVLAATFCLLAMSQTANAKALTGVNAMDLNVGTTLQARQAQAEMKEQNCPNADKSARDHVAKAAESKAAEKSEVGGRTVIQ